MISLSNSALNEKLTMSTVKDDIFNEETRKRELGTTDSDESRALVLEGRSLRGRGQGRGHQKCTGRGRPKSQSSGRIFTCDFTVIRRDISKAIVQNIKH